MTLPLRREARRLYLPLSFFPPQSADGRISCSTSSFPYSSLRNSSASDGSARDQSPCVFSFQAHGGTSIFLPPKRALRRNARLSLFFFAGRLFSSFFLSSKEKITLPLDARSDQAKIDGLWPSSLPSGLCLSPSFLPLQKEPARRRVPHDPNLLPLITGRIVPLSAPLFFFPFPF